MTREIREIHSAEAVSARIAELADEIRSDLGSSKPVLLAIAEGARRFATTLAERLAAAGAAPDLVFLRAVRTRGTELVAVELGPLDSTLLEHRDLVVVDDIADEGRTLQAVLDRAREAKPRSLRTAVLVDKRERRSTRVPLHYVGFSVGTGWVIGYGMDLDGKYRELDHLAVLAPPA